MPGDSMDIEVQARIYSRMRVEDRGHVSPCWVSDRATKPNGYTTMYAWGKVRFTHRVAYEAYVGPIPDGLVIDHLCRVRACCNPAHLEPVTNRENLLRGETLIAAEASATHCVAGHPFTPANTRRTSKGKRHCRACDKRRAQDYRDRKRAALAGALSA